MDLTSEKLYALVSAQASSIDGVTYDLTKNVGVSASLGTMAELVQRVMNRITSPSNTVLASAGSVHITYGTGSLSGQLTGLYHGYPFALSGLLGNPSAALGSQASTTSTTIRKVLVTLALSAFPIASSLASGAATVQFVYGSAFATSANAVSLAAQSAYFNSVPLPKPSAGEIPLAWINVFNSFTALSVIGTSMVQVDWRETQGLDLSALIGTPTQP